ncbi:hypothetical protein [Streptacidiphilus cavernicola]|uniref:Uncharacterized protein n=1 Tax=Streptacidiphilus cavernicola TaxID=3342716 RepID=A0ABV6VYJ9_9ACTN
MGSELDDHPCLRRLQDGDPSVTTGDTIVELTPPQLVLWVVQSEAHRHQAQYERSMDHLKAVASGMAQPNPQFMRALPGDILSRQLWQRSLTYVSTGVDDYDGPWAAGCPETADPVLALRRLLDDVEAPVLSDREIRPIAVEFRKSEIEAYDQWARRCREVLGVAEAPQTGKC